MSELFDASFEIANLHRLLHSFLGKMLSASQDVARNFISGGLELIDSNK